MSFWKLVIALLLNLAFVVSGAFAHKPSAPAWPEVAVQAFMQSLA